MAYAVSTLGISFLMIVFAEITPKVIGATYPERIALPLAYVLGRCMTRAAARDLVRQPVLAAAAARRSACDRAKQARCRS
jgi:CBS domain containing-hemolysin-like protein